MNKPLTKEQRLENEEFRYKTKSGSPEIKELVSLIPDDTSKVYILECQTWEEAKQIRVELYNLRRSVCSFKYFRPDIIDKVTRFTLSVQGNKLVLRLKPSRYFSHIVGRALANGKVISRSDLINYDPSGEDPAMRSLAAACAEAEPELDFPEEPAPEPKQDPDAYFDKAFPTKKEGG